MSLMFTIFLLICIARIAALPCRLEPVPGEPKRYTMSLWGRPVVRTCQRGVFVKKACRCIQVKSGTRDQVEPENIIGGRQIHISEAPWTVFIEEIDIAGIFEGELLISCGGALIGSRWVVTARHCVDDRYILSSLNSSVTTQRVRAGISLRRERHARARAGIVTVSTFTVFIDPESAKTEMKGTAVIYGADFALLHLTHHIWPLRNVIHYIQVATEYKTHRERHCSLTGMGCTKEGTVDRRPRDPSPYLQKTNIFPLRKGDNRCRPILQDLHVFQCHPFCGVDPRVLPICDNRVSQNITGLAVACQGDSGGPLVCPGPSGTPVLVGVLSGATKNCERGSPNMFANVAVMRKFIDETIADNP